MTTLIHGGDNVRSLAALETLISSADDLSTTRLVGSDLDLNKLREALDTPSFTGLRVVVVDDLSKNRSSNFLLELKKYLPTLDTKSQLIIYERKTLPPESSLLSLGVKVQFFPEPQGTSVFDWSDQVGGRNLQRSLSGWEELLQAGNEPEYLLVMLVRQFRLLLLLKMGHRPKVPDFVQRKLQSQLSGWSERDLRLVYQELLQMDRHNKTGAANLNVSMVSFLSSVGKLVKTS